MVPASRHDSHFSALDSLLTEHLDLWQVRPFHSRTLCWAHSRPDLCAALLALDEPTLGRLERDGAALARWLQPWLGDHGDQLLALARLPALPARPLAIPERFATGIPGRKWAQIQAFAAVLPAEGCEVLEWCAGKGHLGRLLAVIDGRAVTSLEWQPALCRAGEQEAARTGVPVRFAEADAFAADSGSWLPAQGQAVALHACGDLHIALMRHWVAGDCRRLTLSPCCYHLTRDDTYQPLSTRALASALRLDKRDLQMPVQEAVTGGQCVQRQRRTELLWRLAFDEWQRERRGEDRYLPVPAFPKKLLSATFSDFCRWAAAAKGLAVPDAIDPQHWLRRGEHRLALTRRMELLGRPFRRPLELWLVLDRVLFLEEHGARVRLGTFCPKPLTPRNILIDAEWPGN